MFILKKVLRVMRYPHLLALIVTLGLISGTSTTFAGDADTYRRKAEAAFAGQRYLQAATYASQVLAENRSDKRMHILLVRASDKMGASRQHVSDLYRQAIVIYPSDAKLLAFAAAFYRRLGYEDYAGKLVDTFDKSCAFNCTQILNQSNAER